MTNSTEEMNKNTYTGLKEAQEAYRVKAQALRKRYRAKMKDFTGEDAGKAIIASYIYRAYSIAAGNADPAPLFSSDEVNAIRASAETRNEREMFAGYMKVAEWATLSLSAASSQLDYAASLLSHFYTLLRMAICSFNMGKSITEETGEKIGKVLLDGRLGNMWLHSLSVEHNMDSLRTLYHNFAAALRYLNGYNTAVELVAKEIKIKEFKERYAINTSQLFDLIDQTNEALELLRDVYKAKVEDELEEYLMYVRDFLEWMYPIKKEADPPLEDKRIKDAKALIAGLYIFKSGGNTGLIMQTLLSGYWR